MNSSLKKTESRLVLGMSMLMSIRMLGISMIIPVFSIMATEITGSSETLAGIAVGIFGVSQVLFLMPMGRLSDRWGRKQATLLGLAVYFAGTVLSGLSVTIYQLIISRFIAGAGAVSGVAIAWLTDGVDEGRRNRALSYVGMSIGFSVITGFTISPLIAGKYNFPVLFFVCAGITLVAFIFTAFFLDNSKNNTVEYSSNEEAISRNSVAIAFKTPDMLKLCMTGMVSNGIITSVFFIMPLLFRQEFEISSMWRIYVSVAFIGTMCMFYFSRKADQRGVVSISLYAFGFMGAGLILATVSGSFLTLIGAFIFIYAGHCILAPILPAAVSFYPGEIKGTVLSIFNASQFAGSAIGGVVSGLMLKYAGDMYFLILFIFMFVAAFQMIRFNEFRDRV